MSSCSMEYVLPHPLLPWSTEQYTAHSVHPYQTSFQPNASQLSQSTIATLWSVTTNQLQYCHLHYQSWMDCQSKLTSLKHTIVSQRFSAVWTAKHINYLVGTTVFCRPRNFERSRGICCFAAEMSRATEFTLYRGISQISGNIIPNVCFLAV